MNHAHMHPVDTGLHNMPPSPLTFQRYLIDRANEQGLSASEPVGVVVLKMSKDLRVMPMVQFHQWYEQKHELMVTAMAQQGMFVYAQTILTEKQIEELYALFHWIDPSASHRPINLLQ